MTYRKREEIIRGILAHLDFDMRTSEAFRDEKLVCQARSKIEALEATMASERRLLEACKAAESEMSSYSGYIPKALPVCRAAIAEADPKQEVQHDSRRTPTSP